MAEATFNLATPQGTGEKTKFQHVLNMLSQETAQEVINDIRNPDLVQEFKQLLLGEKLGNQKSKSFSY